MIYARSALVALFAFKINIQSSSSLFSKLSESRSAFFKHMLIKSQSSATIISSDCKHKVKSCLEYAWNMLILWQIESQFSSYFFSFLSFFIFCMYIMCFAYASLTWFSDSSFKKRVSKTSCNDVRDKVKDKHSVIIVSLTTQDIYKD